MRSPPPGGRTEPLRTDSPRAVTLGLTLPIDDQGDALDQAVAAAVQGDRAALSRVLETIRPVVVRYCRARVGPGDRVSVSTDDVAQEVCLAVVTALPRYRDQGRPFMAFVYGIAAHKVADAHRGAARNRAEPVADVPDAPTIEHGPEQRAVERDAAWRMSGLLDTLPERQREILVLRLVVGLSAEETAQAVGGTAGSVRVAQHRALSKLKLIVGATAAADTAVSAGPPRHARRRIVQPGVEGSTSG